MSWTLLRAFLRGPRSPYRRYRPQVESLEGRCLPTTVTNLSPDVVPGSLQQALLTPGPDHTVDFAPGLTGTIRLTTATLAIPTSVNIRGPGTNVITIDGTGELGINVLPGATVTMSGLTIANCSGSLFNQGNLTVIGCSLNGNLAYFPGNTPGGRGGAIYNKGTLTVIGCTFSGNTTFAYFIPPPTSGPAGLGGAIYNDVGDSLTVINSTFSSNAASSASSMSEGGAIYNAGNLSMVNSTLTLNSSGGSGGGIFLASTSGSVILTNDIIAGNTAAATTSPNGADVFGAVTQADHNLIGIGDGSSGLVNGQNGNQVGTAANPINPKLGPLQFNGGSTPTRALLSGSPAIDAGDNAAQMMTGATDQRGLPRIVNGTIDIGAFEVQGPAPANGLFAVGGAPGRVQVHRVSDGSLVADFAPYGPDYTGGVSVAVGDVDGDGFPDLITGAARDNPHVEVFSGQALLNNFNPANPGAALLASFFAYGLNFDVGVNVAVGDVFANGFADIVTAATIGNPHIKVFDSRAIANHSFNGTNPDASLAASFFAYGLQFNVGANVAVGDVNHDGFADVITAPPAGNPQVKVYDGQAIANHAFRGPHDNLAFDTSNPDAHLLTSFFAFGLNFNIGAFVSVADVTGNGFGDVIVGASAGNPQVKVYDGQAIANHTFNGGNPDASLLTMFFAYGLNQNIGASVSAAAFDVGGPADILTGAAQGSAHYRLVRGLASGIQPPAEHGIDTIASDITGGILVGAG